jgi:hypothetical protein
MCATISAIECGRFAGRLAASAADSPPSATVGERNAWAPRSKDFRCMGNKVIARSPAAGGLLSNRLTLNNEGVFAVEAYLRNP